MTFRRVLVTGGAGFIGSHLVDELLGQGCEVVVYDNFSTGRRDFLPPAATSRLWVVEGEVRDLERLRQALNGCDFVFHFQANADVRGGRENPRIDLEQNTLATWTVLEAIRLSGVKGLAFASSAAVYGEPDVFPTPESHAPLQTSLYGASKLAGEAMIQAYSEYYGIRSFMYRFVSWIGERYTHGIVFDVLNKLARDPKRLPLLGDGSQRKSYLYVRDGVEGIRLSIAKATGLKNVFNLGHDTYLTVAEVARVILDELGMGEVRLEFAGGERGWVGDSPLVQLDTTRVKRLGWQPQTSIEEGIRRTVRYLRSNSHLLTQRGV